MILGRGGQPGQQKRSYSPPINGETQLDPVLVGVVDEGDRLHAAVRQPLLPVDAQVIEARTGIVQAVDRHAQVAEALRIAVAVVVGKVRVRLGTVLLPRQKRKGERKGELRFQVSSKVCLLCYFQRAFSTLGNGRGKHTPSAKPAVEASPLPPLR